MRAPNISGPPRLGAALTPADLRVDVAALQALVQTQGRALEALRARVERLECRRRAPHADAARDGRLLSELAVVFGGSVFSLADLAARRREAELAGLLDGLSGRAIGAWLRRLRDSPHAGYVLARVGRDAAGALWALRVYAL